MMAGLGLAETSQRIGFRLLARGDHGSSTSHLRGIDHRDRVICRSLTTHTTIRTGISWRSDASLAVGGVTSHT